jgi:hypothetical protein
VNIRKLPLLLASASLLTAVAASAGEPLTVGASRHEAEFAVNMLQSSYSKNWNGGDKGSVNWSVTFAGRHEKQMSAKFNWQNTLKLAYGQNHQQARGTDGSLTWLRADKNTDAIEFESLGRLTVASGWDPYVAVGFSSLFRDLSDAAGRDLSLNPKTFRESAGVSRQLVATEKRSLSMRLGLGLSQSSRRFFDEPAPATTTQSETAYTTSAELVTEYKSALLGDRVAWESKLTIDRPLTWSGKSVFEDGFTSTAVMPDDIADYTTALDLDWENTLSANITKVISVKLFTRWVYDKYDNSVKPVVGDDGVLVNEADVLTAIRPAGQFKQTLALGFGYKF